MKEHRIIDIEDLVVDDENPRFEAVSTEDDAFYSILADQKLGSGNKILNLARDIATHGLNASESLIVSPIEGTDAFLVREGNRRVTAIKLSLNSARVPDDFGKLAPHFEELADAMRAHRLIECYICDDEEEIRRLLLLRHGGESNGVGTVKWNSTQTERFAEGGNPQTARALSLIGHLQEDYGQGDLWRAAAVIPPTNLGRFITTPEVRDLLNISMVGNNARYLGEHDKLLLAVLKTIESRGVKAVFYKDDRIRLVKETAERVELDKPRQAHLQLDDVDSNAAVGSNSEPELDGSVQGQAPAYDDAGHGHNASDDDAQPDSDPHLSNVQTEHEQSYEESRCSESDETKQPDDGAQYGTRRRKPVSSDVNKSMFGHILNPRDPESNNVYRGIDWIDRQYLKLDDKMQAALLPILGFSLRLLMETVARKYYEGQNKDGGDKALRDFLKEVAKPAIKAKLDVVGRNNLALASEWIDGAYNFEGLFAKWAHGTLAVDRAPLVRQSEMVALIIDEVWT